MRFDADAYDKLFHSNDKEPDVKPQEPEDTVPDDEPESKEPDNDEGGE